MATDTGYMSNTTPHPKRSLRSNTILSSKKSRQTIFKEIVDQCKSNDIRDLELVYEGVDPADGQILAASLEADSSFERSRARNYNPSTEVLRVKLVTTEIPEAHEIMLLDHGAPGPQFTGFHGLYGAARKTADWICRVLTCRVDTARLPRIAIESGWSENFPNLQRDKLVGGAPDVQLVILLKWTKLSRSRAKGLIQVVPGSGNGNDVWDFDISTLRTIAREKLAAMGLTAAT
ncbi:hypothetical protein V8E54_012140 [Elaphomyces granulatus]